MTGRNPNVFYEVGYAHALNKLVLLLTQTADDIPFDLKHRPHTIYGGEIETLRNKLVERLTWALEESRRRGRRTASSRLAVSCHGIDIPELAAAQASPRIQMKVFSGLRVGFDIRNVGRENSDSVSHAYVFTQDGSPIEPAKRVSAQAIMTRSELVPLDRFHASETDRWRLGLEWQYRLPVELPPIPPGGVESLTVAFRKTEHRGTTARLSLRLHTGAIHLDYLLELVAENEEAGS